MHVSCAGVNLENIELECFTCVFKKVEKSNKMVRLFLFNAPSLLINIKIAYHSTQGGSVHICASPSFQT